MKCKHCGKDSETETHTEIEARYFREALAEEAVDPAGYKAAQLREAARLMYRGCSFGNYEKNKISVFQPYGGGSYGRIYGEAANELGKTWQPERYATINKPSV